jgi:hypothetical protein
LHCVTTHGGEARANQLKWIKQLEGIEVKFMLAHIDKIHKLPLSTTKRKTPALKRIF